MKVAVFFRKKIFLFFGFAYAANQSQNTFLKKYAKNLPEGWFN